MRGGIVKIGALALALGACTPDERDSTVATGATAQIPIPAMCPAIPAFPAGTRVLGPAERPALPPIEGFAVDAIFARWESAALAMICMCHVSEDIETEILKPGVAAAFARQMVISGNMEALSNRVRDTPPAPGFETVAIRNDKAAVLRVRGVAKGKCISIGLAGEPNPIVRENRTVADRWFDSWKFADGRPVAVVPLSEAWNQRRFD
jgi:hypothetical protein